MTNTIFLWVALVIIALLIEAGTPGLFYFLSFACGSIAAALAGYYECTLTCQLICCFSVSCLALFFLWRWVANTTGTVLQPAHSSNTAALIGEKALVVEPILPNGTGRVKIYGDIWLAREKDNGDVNAGSEVVIIKVRGCHLIVKKTIN